MWAWTEKEIFICWSWLYSVILFFIMTNHNTYIIWGTKDVGQHDLEQNCGADPSHNLHHLRKKLTHAEGFIKNRVVLNVQYSKYDDEVFKFGYLLIPRTGMQCLIVATVLCKKWWFAVWVNHSVFSLFSVRVRYLIPGNNCFCIKQKIFKLTLLSH